MATRIVKHKTGRWKQGTLTPDGRRAEPGGYLNLSQVLVLTLLQPRVIEHREGVGAFPMRKRRDPIPYWLADDINDWLDNRDLDPAWAGRPSLEAALAGRLIDERSLLDQAPAFDGEIKSAQELIAHAVPVDRFAHAVSGIYFLWRQGVIVYVGQTRTGLPRLFSHIADPQKDFDSFSFVRCAVSDLDRAERAYIDQFMPEHNSDWLTHRKRREAAPTFD